MKIEIFRDLLKGYPDPDQVVEIGDGIPCRIRLMVESDESDPLNQMRVLAFTFGEKFGGRIMWGTDLDLMKEIVNIDAAMRALLIYAIDNAAELRDHLKAAG